MAIREQITVDIATVAINDEYRVDLVQLSVVQDYSPEQARALADELRQAADLAEQALRDDEAERFARMRAATPRTISGEAVL
ncbi:hypothetical protein [Leucobacter luti]|uniref:hypothetical protein n=1 Tax=Leucobacter luti TaxID=340320 RepID=UPI003CFDE7CC